MLGQIFKKRDEESLEMDYDKLRELTDRDFVHYVKVELFDLPIRSMRIDGSKKSQFVYFTSGKVEYSFAWDAVKEILIFSKRRKYPSGWRFVVGHKKDEVLV